MAEPVKYLFERNFDPDRPAETEPEPVPLAEHEVRLAEARETAFADGVAEGRRSQALEAQTQFEAKADAIVQALQTFGRKADRAIGEHEAAAAELALVIARAFAPNLVAMQPIVEIEALFADCIEHLRSSPHLAVRVNDTVVDIATGRLKPLAERAGFSGRLIVIGEPEMAPGDCRVEWADGSIVRSLETIEKAVEAKVKHFVAAHHGAERGEDNG